MRRILLFALLLLAGAAQAQQVEALPEKYYNLKGTTAPAYKSLTDTAKARVKIAADDRIMVVGRVVPYWAVVKRQGFTYYMPARYLANFSADPAGDAALLAKNKPKTEEYCQVMAIQPFLSNDLAISIDYGQALNRRDYEKDEYGNIQRFNSAMDALNYMNSQGWELVNSSSVSSTGTYIYNYVMRRRIKN